MKLLEVSFISRLLIFVFILLILYVGHVLTSVLGNNYEKICEMCHITLNKSAISGDNGAISPGGVRIGKVLSVIFLSGLDCKLLDQ